MEKLSDAEVVDGGWPVRRRSLSAIMAGLVVASAPAAAQTRAAFVFTAIPDQDETRLVERFTRIADHLGQRLGVPVRYLPVKSYPAAVTAFTNNQVQLAWFGGFTGVQARRAVAGSEAIAQGAEDAAFRSYVIANTKAELQPSGELPREIAGRSFTFGARASTSGRLMPEFFLRQRFGKAPDEVFARVGFSGDHSRTIQLVQSGAFEAGVLDYSVWDTEAAAGKVDLSKVRVIWESPAYPDYNWSVRGDVDGAFGAGFKDKLRRAILAIEDPELLAHFARSRFIPAANADYAPIEEVARTIGLLS